MAKKEIDTLRAFYERRHPLYASLILHWLFLEATYNGGREWFAEHIHKYLKEGDQEFRDRLARAYRFNHTREAVDLVQKYLFKAKIARNTKNASETVKAFWEKATLSGIGIDQLMRLASTFNSIGGRVAIVVDNNLKLPVTAEGDKPAVISVADAKGQKFKIYAYAVRVTDILDYAFDEDGDGGLLWIKLREVTRNDADPINDDGTQAERVRLWTRTGWQLFEEFETGRMLRTAEARYPEKKVRMIDEGSHSLGRVPVILVDHSISSEPYKAPGLIDDIAYLDRAVANYLSNLDAIIQDQTFSQLAIPAQAMMPGDDAYDKVLELGTKRVFAFDGGSGSTAKPDFISPDPKQAQIILEVIAKIIAEIYHTIGLAGERTKSDNSQGIDNSSGVAKAYDFERVNSLLTSKASSLEKAENEIIELVSLWAGEAAPTEKLVEYPKTFDVMRLADELVTAEALAKLGAPIEVRREQMSLLVDKLFPRLAEDLKTKISADIAKWLEGTDLILNPPTGFAGKPAGAPSRQGQVTKDTPTTKTKAA